jgi:hypothetical protein
MISLLALFAVFVIVVRLFLLLVDWLGGNATAAVAAILFWAVVAIGTPDATGLFFLLFAGYVLLAGVLIAIADYVAMRRPTARGPSPRVSSPEQLERLDKWAAAQTNKPSRPEAAPSPGEAQA